MKTRIVMDAQDLSRSSEVLSVLLADEFVLYMKTRNAHWNIEDINFYEMHKFFEEQYGILDGVLDEVAERIRTLGHYAPGNSRLFSQLSHLPEETVTNTTTKDFVTSLLMDHERIIGFLREKIVMVADEYHDLGSSDFMTGVLKVHEKMAWMLRAHVR